jgi:hypothetical protein
MPTVSITDHQLRGYTHNIVVRYIDNRVSHYVDYCTSVDSPESPNHDEIRDRLYATLALLGTDTAEYILREVTWTDDF